MADATAIPLVNAALTRTGNQTITSFEQIQTGSNEAAIAAANYDDIVNSALGSHPWKWCTRHFELNKVAATPDPPWQFAYERPADLLFLRMVMQVGQPVRYELMSDMILSNHDNIESPLIGEYTYRPSEVHWPMPFRLAIVIALEPVFLRAIGERYDQADGREKAAMAAMANARLRDSMHKLPDNPMQSPLLLARRGWPFRQGDPLKWDQWPWSWR
jgi:hypothetical protein